MASDTQQTATKGTEQVKLANERTFLSWIRTGLALVVTGLAIVTFDVPLPPAWQKGAAIAFIVLGIAAAFQAWLGWRANDAAIRDGEDLPAPALRIYVAAGVAAVAAAIAVGLFLS